LRVLIETYDYYLDVGLSNLYGVEAIERQSVRLLNCYMI